MSFADRRDAGRRLAARLRFLRGEDAVVLALPRGGVPVGFEVAQALAVPLDVIVVRKLGVPFQPELAMGAIGEGGVLVVNDEVLRLAGVTPGAFAEVEQRARAELDRQARRYRGHRPPVQVAGRTAVVVDDGVATGSTARAACQVAKAQGAARVVLAVPVAPPSTVEELEREAEVVCVEAPRHLWAVGQWYRDFTETSDDEVTRLLCECAQPAGVPVAAGPEGDDPPVEADEVEVVAGRARLAGLLTVPPEPAGMVVFAHGSGSSRHSPRNRFVAQVLNRAGLGTLLSDLLTRERGAGPGQRVRHRAPGRPAGRSDGLGARPARVRPVAGRVFRGQHRGRGRPVGRRRPVRRHRRGCVARRPSRLGRPPPGPGPRSHPAHRGRPGRRRARAQPPGPGPAALREPPGGGARRHPPVRGARDLGRRGRASPGLVAHPPGRRGPASLMSLPAGHRLVPHTADCIIEAWARTGLTA